MEVSSKDFNQIMDSVKNTKYNEKLANALKRPLVNPEKEECVQCGKDITDISTMEDWICNECWNKFEEEEKERKKST